MARWATRSSPSVPRRSTKSSTSIREATRSTSQVPGTNLLRLCTFVERKPGPTRLGGAAKTSAYSYLNLPSRISNRNPGTYRCRVRSAAQADTEDAMKVREMMTPIPFVVSPATQRKA
jgi:hypothetical protein